MSPHIYEGTLIKNKSPPQNFYQCYRLYSCSLDGCYSQSYPFFSSPLQLFSIVIFGCIANEGYINRPNEVEEYCIFNRNQNACNYGVFMGSMAFLCCMAFLALDVYFPQISSVKDRKKAVLADIGLSGKPIKKAYSVEACCFYTDT